MFVKPQFDGRTNKLKFVGHLSCCSDDLFGGVVHGGGRDDADDDYADQADKSGSQKNRQVWAGTIPI